ncbi:sugar phosphate nucleotidyltransferase [Halobacillus sp. BBL2006]|uniref:sugar phosphate nucleotidyltransferase n=1 Tax=Halobacillus sp. BBL2006 TaxID=1543706 RepID=UPI000543C3D3|nr:sugar phosphate nucleotidyltransferase [Halobacillus sp. BBL2006]KHE67415.1 mannose-1-phosphate guanylyltransferase [Halobacillus sp. BBL2006]
MKLVLLSGGSGKRLWPLSNDSRSKQFLKVLDNNTEKVSMVQRVWNQLDECKLAKDSVIATSKSQVDMLFSQLGNHVPIVTEPERRDTFPAIALSAVYLYSVKSCSKDEAVCVLPVDPFVDTQFFENVKKLESILEDSGADLALMGVKPTHPSEKYGYILPENKIKGAITVKRFTEKPTTQNAKEFIDQGALWNCGVFSFKLSYILDILIDRGFPIDYEELLKQYSDLPKISFDYQVVENTENIVAIPYNGSWKDLGTWNTLTEEMSSPFIGKGIMSEDTNNSHVVNELDIPIALLGLENTVVAASPDGILVTNKESSPRVKEYVSSMNGRPMYEERRWGWYKVLDYTKYIEGNEVLTKRIGIDSGKNLSYQIHYKRSEVWTIIKGEGIFILNGELRHVRAGDVLHIPLAAKHSIKATTNMEIIEVQSGSELVEEDIIRLSTNWEDIVEQMEILY